MSRALLALVLVGCQPADDGGPGRTVRAREVPCNDLATSYDDRHVEDIVLDGVDPRGWTCLRSSDGGVRWSACSESLSVEDGAVWYDGVCEGGEHLRISWW